MTGLPDRLPRPAEMAVFRRNDPPRALELAIVAVAALVIAAAIFGPHAGSGSLYADDWIWDNTYRFMPGDPHSLADLLAVSDVYGSNYRPGNNLTHALIQLVSGGDQSVRLVIGFLLAALSYLAFYATSRFAGLTRLSASTVTLLLAVLPSLDSTRLLFATYHQTLALSIFMAGLCAAIAALRSDGRRAWGLHALSVALFAAAIFTFEVFGVMMLATFALYWVALGERRPALIRGGADIAVAAIGLAIVAPAVSDLRTPDYSIGHIADRIGDLVPALVDMFRFSLPFDGVLWGPLGIVLAAALVYGVILSRRTGGAGERRLIGQWLGVAAAGLVIAVLAYGPLVTGIETLTPSWQGADNRMNVIGGLGHVLVLAAVLWLGALGAAGLLRRPTLTAPLAAVAIAVTASGLVAQQLTNFDDWDLSALLQERAVEVADLAIGEPAREGQMTIVQGFPYFTAGGAPIFLNADISAAVERHRDEQGLLVWPMPVSGALCFDKGFSVPVFGLDPEQAPALSAAPYPDVAFVDIYEGVVRRPRNLAECREAAGDRAGFIPPQG